jgi:hypothetical protein
VIRYSLRCATGHGFESWFHGGDAFAALVAKGQLSCPICGDAKVEKDLMAPAVRPARMAKTTGNAATGNATTGVAVPDLLPERPSLSEPASELEAAVAALRRQIEANSDYVGMNFVTEARRIHAGEAPERAIYGEAKPDEARQMIEDGLPVAPLPFMPARKVN